MNRRLLLAAFLLSAATAFAQNEPPTRPDVSKVYGPSWLAYSRPGPNTRPAKLDRDEIAGTIDRTGNGMAVQVSFWADVADLKKGHQYELRYQLRVHTKKGETGPLLGNSSRPEGVGYPIATATAGENWLGLEGTVDVTRKDLSAATNLPKPGNRQRQHTVLLRVEPQVFDVTAEKYVTPGKTTAIVLAAEVSEGGKVWEVRPLGEWVGMNRGNTADATLALVATLDEYDPTTCGLERGIETVLDSEDVKADVKAKFVAAIPADRVGWKVNFNLKRKLEQWADGSDETLKAAAKQKLAKVK